MEKYMVIVKIKNAEFLVNVSAKSAYAAEHSIMDMGICGRHEYTVEGCTAFDFEAMKTDCFIGMAIRTKTVSLKELFEIIEYRNAEIKAKDEAEIKVKEIEKQMARLQEELEAAKKILEA